MRHQLVTHVLELLFGSIVAAFLLAFDVFLKNLLIEVGVKRWNSQPFVARCISLVKERLYGVLVSAGFRFSVYAIFNSNRALK